MLKVKALHSIAPWIEKNKFYFIGGLIQNSNAVVLLDENKDKVPYSFPCETFGFTRTELIDKIKGK